MRLAGRTALITGASSGIGRATALELARRGMQVRLTGRDRTALADVAEATGGRWMVADLGRDDEVDRLAAWARSVDLLVNNAGFGWVGPFAAADRATGEPGSSGGMEVLRARELLAANLLAPIVLTRMLLPGMLQRGHGHVVMVSSIAGHVGVRGESVYAASKAGLIGFAESLRYELAGTGVGLSVVSPGVVDTPFFRRQGRQYDRAFPRLIGAERVARAIAEAVTVGRAQVFVPRWMAVPAWLRGAWPGLYRALAGRYG